MPKDRHRGRKVQFWLSDDDFRRFDSLRGAGCKTDKDAVLKLLELAEAGKQESEAEHNKVKTLDSQIDKLLHDLKDRDRKIEELEKQPKFEAEYADTAIHVQRRLEKLDTALSSLNSITVPMRKLIKDATNYLTEQSQLSKIEPKVEYRDRVMEKPQYIEKTVTVEKIMYKDRLEGLQILCNMRKGFVSLTDECLHKCQDVATCSYYYSIVVEKKIPEDAKLTAPCQ
jgi:hypothetical protein